MIYTLGESLLDVIFTSMEEVVAKPGGSMLNAAVSLGRMKLPVTHISEMGSNQVADMMLEFLNKNGVDTTYIVRYQGENTSVALAFLDDNKKPSYQFVNAYPKSRKLIFPPTFQPDDILLFGSLYSISTPIRPYILECIQQAKKAGSLVVYDPNIRHKHHLEEKNVKEAMLENLRLADVIKASDEDCANLFGENSPNGYLEQLSQINSKALIFLTLGASGALAQVGSEQLRIQAIPLMVVSTIGAGDAFNAGVISAIQEMGIAGNQLIQLNPDEVMSILRRGTEAASKVCCSMENYIPDITGA